MRARLPFLLLALGSGLLVGCGGNDSNSGECVATVTANAAYAGNYVVTYTPDASSSAQPVTFNLTALREGFLNGSGTDSATGKTVTLTGSNGSVGGDPSFAGDDNQCEEKTYVRIVFTRSATTTVEDGAVIEELRGSTKQSGSLVGTYKASNLLGGSTLSSGTITVSRKPDAVE